MIKVGFTGTQLGMRGSQKSKVQDLLMTIGSGDFHHGDCKGADIEAAELAYKLGFKIYCHPPINPKTRGWFRFNHETFNPYDYTLRDEHIVEDTDFLISAPNTPYEIIRSGTWTTVRYARELGKRILIVTPNGDVTEEPAQNL